MITSPTFNPKYYSAWSWHKLQFHYAFLKHVCKSKASPSRHAPRLACSQSSAGTRELSKSIYEVHPPIIPYLLNNGCFHVFIPTLNHRIEGDRRLDSNNKWEQAYTYSARVAGTVVEAVNARANPRGHHVVFRQSSLILPPPTSDGRHNPWGKRGEGPF